MESPFSPFANGQLPFVSSSANGITTNFRLHDEQTVNGLRKIAWGFVFRLKPQEIFVYIHTYIYIYMHICIYIYVLYICIYVYPEKGANGKR